MASSDTGSHPFFQCGQGAAAHLGVARLFVAAANTNNVYSVGVTESNELRVLESINAAMTPRHPLGMTPSALALSRDGNQLYVVCSDANAVAVVDISQARADVRGFIPTGWYPTAARALASDKLVILSGRGLRSYPNPKDLILPKLPRPAMRVSSPKSMSARSRLARSASCRRLATRNLTLIQRRFSPTRLTTT